MMQPDQIEIRRLKVETHIGVPEVERAVAQTLLVSIRMTSTQGFHDLRDDISRTIDYYAVSLEIKELSSRNPRCLIETLAVEIAEYLLAKHSLKHVAVTIEKHILPDTECVAVHVERGIWN